jgi:lipopolysaccharide export system permease protein
MRILTRYLLRTHLAPFLFSLSVLTGLLFVNTIARRIPDLAGKGLGMDVIGDVLAFSLPHIVALTMPMAVLVAVLYTFSQLTADNEITALKASGVSLIRLMMPLVAGGIALALVLLWFNDDVLPESNHALKNLLADVGRKSPTFELKEQTINPIRSQNNMRSQYFLQAARIEHAENRLYDVVIYDLSLGQKTRTIYADSGRMAFNAEQTDLLLTLYDGWVHDAETWESAKFQRAKFQRYLLEMAGVGDVLTRMQDTYRGDREMNIGALRAAADSAYAEYLAALAEAEEQSVAATRRALAGPIPTEGVEPITPTAPSVGAPHLDEVPPEYRLQAMQVEGNDEVAHRAAVELSVLRSQTSTHLRTSNTYRVEYHKKFAIPVACIVFVLLGAPIAVRFPRGGVGMVIAISLLVFGIYYMSLIGGESLGDRGRIPPFLGPWGPNIVFFAIAVWTLSRIGRVTSTTRGGGWDDLWLTARSFLTRPFRRRPAGSPEVEEARA